VAAEDEVISSGEPIREVAKVLRLRIIVSQPVAVWESKCGLDQNL
jgi:hypothetical protein